MVARVEYLCIKLRGVSKIVCLEEFDIQLPKEAFEGSTTLTLHVGRAFSKEVGRKESERRGITTVFRFSSSCTILLASYNRSGGDHDCVVIDPS